MIRRAALRLLLAAACYVGERADRRVCAFPNLTNEDDTTHQETP